MELVVYASTSGHLLVACSLEVILMAVSFHDVGDVHVTIAHTPRLLLWAMTIFVRVLQLREVNKVSSIQMPHSGMARFVRVVAHAASSTILHGSPRT